jgi:hypothetical protein
MAAVARTGGRVCVCFVNVTEMKYWFRDNPSNNKICYVELTMLGRPDIGHLIWENEMFLLACHHFLDTFGDGWYEKRSS